MYCKYSENIQVVSDIALSVGVHASLVFNLGKCLTFL